MLPSNTTEVNEHSPFQFNQLFSSWGGYTNRIQITGSAKSGEGVVNLDGFAILEAQAGWPVELMLKGENFEVAKLPEAQIAVSPDLKFVFAERKGKVTGNGVFRPGR